MTIRNFENNSPKVAETAFVDEASVVTGDVIIGADSSERTNIQDGSVLHVTHDSEYAPGGHALEIGNDVTVGHNVVLHACTVEDECLIGMGAIVLDGAVVKRGAMVGAGSLVSPGKVLEGGYLWLGSPVKRARELNEKEKAFFKYSAQHYVALKDRHRS